MIVILWTGLGESGGKINFWWGSILGAGGGRFHVERMSKFLTVGGDYLPLFCPPVEKSLQIENFSPKTSQPFIWDLKIFFGTFPYCVITAIAKQK